MWKFLPWPSKRRRLLEVTAYQARTRPEGVDRELLQHLADFGEPMFLEVLIKSREFGNEPNKLRDVRSICENWHAVFQEFCTRFPIRAAEITDHPPDSRIDVTALVWVLSEIRDQRLRPYFIRWLNHSTEWFREHAVAYLIRQKDEQLVSTLLTYLDQRPLSPEISKIVDAMNFWPPLRQKRSLHTLKRIAAEHKHLGVKRWAAELASCIEQGKDPRPREDWELVMSPFN